jgi:hypothetical protein
MATLRTRFKFIGIVREVSAIVRSRRRAPDTSMEAHGSRFPPEATSRRVEDAGSLDPQKAESPNPEVEEGDSHHPGDDASAD